MAQVGPPAARTDPADLPAPGVKPGRPGFSGRPGARPSSLAHSAAMQDIPYECLRTLVLYAAAEAQAGHASQVDVSLSDTGFTVQDNG